MFVQSSSTRARSPITPLPLYVDVELDLWLELLGKGRCRHALRQVRLRVARLEAVEPLRARGLLTSPSEASTRRPRAARSKLNARRCARRSPNAVDWHVTGRSRAMASCKLGASAGRIRVGPPDGRSSPSRHIMEAGTPARRPLIAAEAFSVSR
jgi:hypothetical protein